MSRLSLLTAMAALALTASGAAGLALSPTEPDGNATKRIVPAPAPQESSKQSGAPALPRRRLHLRPGESLAEGLIRSGVGGLDAALAEQALAGHPIAPGRPLRLWLGRLLPGGARELNRLEARSSDGLTQVLQREMDSFRLASQGSKVDDTPVRLRLDAGPALAHDLQRAGLPSAERARVLALATEGAASRLDLIIAHEEEEGDRRFGALLYVALTAPSGEVRRWLGNEQGALEPVDASPITTGLKRPVSGPVSSSVGLRFHPVLRFFRWHRGTDFAAPEGTPVLAAAEGRIIDAGWRGSYGNLVRLAHEDGTVTAYAHLSQVHAEIGTRVPRGAVIGLVGSSGLATGPHLHFEWLRNGVALEPSFTTRHAVAQDPEARLALQLLLAAPYREPPALGS